MTKTRRIEPVVKRVRVPASPEAAFRRFTGELGRWWPLATHSVGRESAESVVLEGRIGGRIVERTRTGEEHVWGTVTAWSPPVRVAFTWHPGRDPATAQEVEVRFEAGESGAGGEPGRTDVTLVHGGWERYGEGAAASRDEYVEGWAYVLGLYAES